MSQTSTTALFEESADLIKRSVRLGLQTLLDIHDDSDLRSLADRIGDMGRSCGCATPVLSRAGSSGCDIPPPCWYPKAAGEVTSFGCPGGTAVLRVRVHNCGPSSRHVQLEGAADAKFEPSGLSLKAMEREVATIKVTLPENDGAEKELLLWIRGCHAHYVRWRVVATKRGSDACCHELDVEDCPDYLHHWYDHFYCVHPCMAQHSTNA